MCVIRGCSLDRTGRNSLEDRGLRAERQHVPALEGVDSLGPHQPHVRSLKVERFRRPPLESHDRIEGRRYRRTRACRRRRRRVRVHFFSRGLFLVNDRRLDQLFAQR